MSGTGPVTVIGHDLGVIETVIGFTDGTVFAPIADEEHVWFFNRCGSMGCYDRNGNELWYREWKPRFKHNNRQAAPFLVGDAIKLALAAMVLPAVWKLVGRARG